MNTFTRVFLKGLLQLLAALLFFASLILIALAIFGTDETTAARVWYGIGGAIGIPLSVVLLVLSNPKDVEGDFIFILLSLINWPR
jgi:hypothetical protein